LLIGATSGMSQDHLNKYLIKNNILAPLEGPFMAVID